MKALIATSYIFLSSLFLDLPAQSLVTRDSSEFVKILGYIGIYRDTIGTPIFLPDGWNSKSSLINGDMHGILLNWWPKHKESVQSRWKLVNGFLIARGWIVLERMKFEDLAIPHELGVWDVCQYEKCRKLYLNTALRKDLWLHFHFTPATP